MPCACDAFGNVPDIRVPAQPSFDKKALQQARADKKAEVLAKAKQAAAAAAASGSKKKK